MPDQPGDQPRSTSGPTRLRDELRRVPGWLWALLFAVALCLPRLSGFGFWDPWELKLAEQARAVANSDHLFDPTADGKYPGGRALGTTLSAVGIRMFGAKELGARLPLALAAIGALMAVYWAGRSLLRKRGALLAMLALGTMPLFVLEARQLNSDAPLIATLALALGGLARFAWPPDGKRRERDLLIALAGLGLGIWAGGFLLGFVLPVLSIVLALIIGHGLRPIDAAAVADGTGPLADPGIGPDLPVDRSLGASTLRPRVRAFWAIAVLAVVAVVALVIALTGLTAGKYSMFLGAAPRAAAPTRTFDFLVRQLGFGLFPWSAVAIFALARPLTRLDGEGPATNTRLAFVQLFLLVTAGLGFALSGYLAVVVGDVRYVALPAIALALGAFLDEALEGNAAEPVAGLVMAVGTMVVARDFFQAPEEIASIHVLDKVKWPSNVSLGPLFLLVGLIAAAGIYAGLAARTYAVGKTPTQDGSAARPFWRFVRQRLIDAGRFGIHAAVATTVVFAFVLAQVLVPTLSTHLSFKPVLESYTKFARPGDKIGKYRIEGHGSTFYSKQTMVELPNQDRVVAFLRDSERVFAMVPTDDLAALDAAFKQAKVAYHVVDASSSRFLLLTNRLDGGQTDQNPLRNNVWMPPGDDVSAAPPWKWRVPVSATFSDSIELVGADFPESIRRPGKIPMDLFFRVKTRPAGSYKIFVHFDGPAAPRVIGDHDPVNRAFSTSYWLPGEYVRDHYETDVPLMTTPAGTYVVYIGFWPGGEQKRLKITQGPNDGADRVRLGTIEIK